MYFIYIVSFGSQTELTPVTLLSYTQQTYDEMFISNDEILFSPLFTGQEEAQS